MRCYAHKNKKFEIRMNLYFCNNQRNIKDDTKGHNHIQNIKQPVTQKMPYCVLGLLNCLNAQFVEDQQFKILYCQR